MAIMAANRTTTELEKVFEQELLPHADAVYNFGYHLCLNEVDSKDLTQETYFRAWKNIESYESGTNPKAWLMTICRNQFINNYRKKQTRGIPVSYEDIVTYHQKATADTRSRYGNLHHDIHSNLMGDEVTRAVNALSPENRMVLLLCDIEDFSYEEIAKIAAIPIGTVRSRLHRARKLLKERLRGYAEKMGFDTDNEPGEAR